MQAKGIKTVVRRTSFVVRLNERYEVRRTMYPPGNTGIADPAMQCSARSYGLRCEIRFYRLHRLAFEPYAHYFRLHARGFKNFRMRRFP
jgi:hypothetical protein